MTSYFWILIILVAELLIFLTEIVLASANRMNKVLRRKIPFENNSIINLDKGFRTSISVFRFSLFVVYIILVVLFFNTHSDNLFEELVLYVLGGILIYMVSLMNSKIFVFYSTYFVISSPFNFFRKDLIINYSSIDEYEIYRALYNSFYLKLIIKDSKTLYIHFSGSYLPKNDLVLRYVLDKKTNLKKSNNIIDF